MKIVAIGGGEIGRPRKEGGFYPVETLTIDREIIRLTGKEHPKLLFLPTASGDSEGYYKVVEKYFGGKLGCKVDVLNLIKEKYSRKETAERIFGSDIVYVGGGNTMKMLKVWRTLGVDDILREAGEKGVILSGLSAGAICWFNYGNSDSLKFSSGSNKVIRLRGLGFVSLTACPHYDFEKNRKSSLSRMIREHGGIALALDNCAAIEVVDDTYRIVVSKPGAKAYKVYKIGNKVRQEVIPIRKEFSPLEELTS